MTTLISALAFLQAASLPAIIPQPLSLEAGESAFILDARTHLVASEGAREVADQLRGYLSPGTGFHFDPTRRAGNDTINLVLDKNSKALGPEGYHLSVRPAMIEIRASSPAGLFYGVQSLRQMLPPDSLRKSAASIADWRIPSVEITDSPRFVWRGAMVDTARHFMPKEFILKFLDLMAFHKLNVFHWHLTDNNGWRLEIKKYPRLTEKASAMDYSSMNPSEATRSINQKPGGFYTQADVREIVKYAADRFITVLPEVEMPGHAEAAIIAYPELGNRKETVESGGKFPDDADNVYNVEDKTIAFVKDVLDETMALFPNTFIHVGGDEVDKQYWKANPMAQARIKELGLKNEDELQSWFIKQMDAYLTSKGRRLVGWDEILEGGLAQNATVMSWRGVEGGIQAAKAGHDVIMAPTSHTYFDYLQSSDPKKEPKGIGGFISLETVYSFNPIVDGLTAEEAKHVLGTQAQLWSEFIPMPKHMEYMAFPRFCALSEVAWSDQKHRNYSDFLRRLEPHLVRLKTLDVNYRPLDR